MVGTLKEASRNIGTSGRKRRTTGLPHLTGSSGSASRCECFATFWKCVRCFDALRGPRVSRYVSTLRKLFNASRRFLKLPILQHRRSASWGPICKPLPESSRGHLSLQVCRNPCAGVSIVDPVALRTRRMQNGGCCNTSASRSQSSSQPDAHRVESILYSITVSQQVKRA
jgi:hypothetical protein